jgi:hydrogenase nickel incorporation protein HypA/HybF
VHELSVALEILDIAEREARKAGARGVKAIRLRLGDLSGVERESLLFSFDAVKGEKELTRGAALEVIRVPAKVRCRPCGGEFEAAPGRGPFVACPGCGGFDTSLVEGRELSILDLEVED